MPNANPFAIIFFIKHPQPHVPNVRPTSQTMPGPEPDRLWSSLTMTVEVYSVNIEDFSCLF